MPQTSETDRICTEAWDRALHAFGTAQIFQRRSQKYRRKIRALAFIGIGGPVLIGAMVIHGFAPEYVLNLLIVVGIVSVAEALVSVWSLIANWADNLSYSQRSTTDNLALSSAFRELGQQSQNPPSDLQLRFADLRSRDEARREQDAEKGISEKELRCGHRAGLRQFQRTCQGCKQVPTSMDSTDCSICGRFGMLSWLR
jgi:mobilome CxxCx(11)CxxC protein